MIKAIIFDFFGVLVTEGFKQFQEDYFAEDDEKRRQAIELINEVDSGRIKMSEFTSGLAELAGITPQDVQEALGGNKPNRLLLNFIREKLKKKYKISILSNSSMDYPRKILSPEDAELFDDIILSYRYGMVKPEPGIYELAAERLNVRPDEAIFIDDSPSHIKGAESVGMKGIYYQSYQQTRKELIRLTPIADK